MLMTAKIPNPVADEIFIRAPSNQSMEMHSTSTIVCEDTAKLNQFNFCNEAQILTTIATIYVSVIKHM